MWRSVLAIALVYICTLSPINAGAENIPPGKWWQMPGVAEKLELSSEQKNALDTLFMQSRRNLIDLKGVLEKERFELENLIEKQHLDEAAVMEQFKRLQNARSDLSIERFRFLVKVRKILGFNRYQRLKMMFQEFNERRRRNMGGAGGGRPGQRRPAY